MMKQIAVALTVGGVLAAGALWVAAALEFEAPQFGRIWVHFLRSAPA